MRRYGPAAGGAAARANIGFAEGPQPDTTIAWDVATRAAWGDPASATAWRPLVQGALCGFPSVELPIRLKFIDCPVFADLARLNEREPVTNRFRIDEIFLDEIKVKFDELLTGTEYARLRRCSIRTVERERTARTGCRYVKPGRSVRYKRSDVAKFIERNARHSTSEPVR